MWIKRLQTRFLLAGCVLAMITLGSGLWSAWTFAQLSRVADRVLHDSQTTIDLAAELAGSLEREDDALLLALSGNGERAHHDLADERRRGDDSFGRLRSRLSAAGADNDQIISELRREMDGYRASGSDLLQQTEQSDALQHYHERVNPRLRSAVQACSQIREREFAMMRLAGLQARDEARAATRIVMAASLAALFLATVVAGWLARSVVLPIRKLSSSVEALRMGDFEQNVTLTSADELNQLADGFNRMAGTLAEYRRSSLGELIAAKTTLEATLDALPDAVFVVAPDGDLAALNPPARAILESKRAADVRRIHDLPFTQEHRQAIEEALAGREILPSRADFARAIHARLDGRACKFLMTVVPIPNFAPRRTGAVVVLDDVTEFARLDELRGELVAVASHELKSPLTTLRMNLMLLGEAADAFTPRQREMLEAAMLGCEELGSTTEELLDVARIEAGQLRLAFAPVDLNAILDSTLRLLRTRIDDAEVRLEERREARPAIVRGDPTRLKNVIENLLANAVKYSPRGGRVLVEIVCRRDAGADGPATLQFAVTDAGPGVPEAFRERIFEKFFRVEHHLDRFPEGVRGTGIGLYLCREVIKAHGGSIWCEPAAGGIGTMVAFRLKAEG